MSRIRLRYTGIIAYFSSLLTTLTGLLFTLIITRRLTPDDLGVWRYIGSLLVYFVMPSGLVGYWTTRMTAKGKHVLSTSLTLSSLSAIATTAMFIALSSTLSEQVNTPHLVFVVAAAEIPLISIYMISEAALTARMPERVYYSLIIQELIKLPTAIVLVLFLRLGLLGALLAAVAGFASRALASFFFASKLGFGRPSWSMAFQILRRIWLPLYSGLPNLLGELQFIAVVLILGSSEVLGYASAVLLIGSIVALSGNLSSGLYPQLLHSQSTTAVEIALKMVLMVAIPSAVGGMVLSEHILNLLRPDYKEVTPVLLIALPGTIIYLINNILDATLTGQERADFDESVNFRTLVKSKLFFVPTINIIQSVVYVAILMPLLVYFSRLGLVALLSVWFLTQVLVLVPSIYYKLRLSGYSSVLWHVASPVSRYLLSSIIMGGVISVIKPSVTPTEISLGVAQLIPVLVVGILTYFGSLYAIDIEFRTLVRLIWSNINTAIKSVHD